MKRKKARIYLDHAATTPVDPRVFEAMAPFFSKHFGNPGSIHKEGVVAAEAVGDARKSVADALHARPEEIVFVSGGTEANNLAIFGFTKWLEENNCVLRECHFITTAIEHPSVLECFAYLKKQGAEVSIAPVTREGIIDLEEFKKALRANTVFVSVMFVNSEIGTIQPLGEIAKILRAHREKKLLPEKLKKLNNQFPFFHTDACQAPLFFSQNTQKLGIDYLSLDGQKIYGPKGVGALYRKKGSPSAQLFYGGNQEDGLRPGTLNVPLVVGLAKAMQIAEKERESVSKNLIKLRDYFIKKILEKIPYAELNGDAVMRSPNSVNISIPGIDNEWVVLALDAYGIALSTRSACMTGETSPQGASHVIAALGKEEALAKGSLRFTLGKETTRKDVDFVLDALLEVFSRSVLNQRK